MSDLFCQSQESLNQFDAQTLNHKVHYELWVMAMPDTRMRKKWRGPLHTARAAEQKL
jgi:hypothetical protein